MRTIPLPTRLKLEAQANRIQRDLHKLEMLKCLSQNAPVIMTGTSVRCEECGYLFKCKQFREAIREVRI